MADSYVCSGAMMKCTMGSSPAKLTVLPSRTVFLAGQPMANISDHISMVNLAPFGVCRSLAFPPTAAATAAALGTLTPMPCIHNTPAPWFVGKMDTLIKGQPALLQSCKCQCMWGGTITLINNGQVGEGAEGVNEKPGHNFNQTFSQYISKDLEAENGDISISGIGNPNSQNSPTNNTNKQLPHKKKKPSTPEEIAEYNRVSEIVLKRCENLTDEERKRLQEMIKEMPNNLNNLEKLAIAENNLELEKLFGRPKGKRMSVSEADKQNANPNHNPNVTRYKLDPNGLYYNYNGRMLNFNSVPNNRRFQDQNGRWFIFDPNGPQGPNYYFVERFSLDPEYAFSINCATCAAAYALRLRGFNITAKGKTKNTLNEWLSEQHSFDIWKKLDGSPADPTLTKDWMKKNNLTQMSSDNYKKYFDEVCKDEGVYVLTLGWKEKWIVDSNGNRVFKSPGGHATILQRDSDGNLYWIEPQVYNSNVSSDGRRSIDDLLSHNGGLAANPTGKRGVLRVDDKLFNTKGGIYTTLFNQ